MLALAVAEAEVQTRFHRHEKTGACCPFDVMLQQHNYKRAADLYSYRRGYGLQPQSAESRVFDFRLLH